MSRAGTSLGRTASSCLIAWAVAVALLFLIAPYYPRKPDSFEAMIDRTGAIQRRLERGQSTATKFLRDGKPRFGYTGEFSEGLAVAPMLRRRTAGTTPHDSDSSTSPPNM